MGCGCIKAKAKPISVLQADFNDIKADKPKSQQPINQGLQNAYSYSAKKTDEDVDNKGPPQLSRLSSYGLAEDSVSKGAAKGNRRYLDMSEQRRLNQHSGHN